MPSNTKIQNNKENKNIRENFIDWRIELARIPPMIIVVIVHMLLDSGYIKPNILSPFDWALFFSMATFFYISGHVQGLKNEYEASGSITKKGYLQHVKSRFLRLYPGYYIALISVYFARITAFLLVGKVFIMTPWGLLLDLTSLISILGVFGTEGAIWPIGWFIFALFCIHLLYPFIRRIITAKKIYFYVLIVSAIALRISFLFYLPIAAYFFPLSWLVEFMVGIMIGRWSASTGGPTKPRKKYQKIIIKASSRIWPMYLAHMIPIVFITPGASASLLELVIIFIAVIIMSEIYYWLLKKTNKLIDRVFF